MPRALTVALLAAPLCLAAAPAPNPQIDYPAFMRLTGKVEPIRAKRLVPLAEFKRLAGKGALILDARSADAFAQGHIKGAVNLPFTDFTAESLAETIDKKDHMILIYCNNNFSNNKRPVALKSVAVALNIQTFINLTGYGYTNVRELADTVDFNDPKVEWVSNQTATIAPLAQP